MTVVPLALRAGPWREAETRALLGACAGPLARGEAEDWAVGATEAGEPQFYLLGPDPDGDCILAVSRLGGGYLLEDGQGGVLLEHASLAALAERARTYLRRRRAALAARLVVLWCAVRESWAERWELAEPAELLSHFAPLAALA